MMAETRAIFEHEYPRGKQCTHNIYQIGIYFSLELRFHIFFLSTVARTNFRYFVGAAVVSPRVPNYYC